MEPNLINWYLQQFLVRLMPYAVAAIGITLISVTPLGRAAVSWLKGHVNRGRAAELAADIDRLEHEMQETQERLDFAERRLLTSAAMPEPPRADAAPASPSRIPTPV